MNIVVIGWLNPKQHETDRVLYPVSSVPTFKATDYKNPKYIMVKRKVDDDHERKSEKTW